MPSLNIHGALEEPDQQAKHRSASPARPRFIHPACLHRPLLGVIHSPCSERPKRRRTRTARSRRDLSRSFDLTVSGPKRKGVTGRVPCFFLRLRRIDSLFGPRWPCIACASKETRMDTTSGYRQSCRNQRQEVKNN